MTPEPLEAAPTKPCPFCGGEAVFTVEERTAHPEYGGHSIMCMTCGAGIGYLFACGDDPQPRLLEMWNARALPAAPTGIPTC